MTGELSGVLYRVQAPAQLAGWYNQVLGMEKQETGHGWICGYKGKDCRLFIEKGEGAPYKAERSSVYWKIGLCLQDVDLARDKIIANKTTVSQASQFKDIGYLCHLSDPAGFSLELLQHTFQHNFSKLQEQGQEPLGQPAVVGQITLRSSDIQKSLDFYQTTLGMKLLSIQGVEEYGFTLYFLAFTDEEPPSSDLDSVDNREWLWQRPYTTLELQYRAGAPLVPVSEEGQGVAGILISTSGEVVSRLDEKGYSYAKLEDKRVKMADPDGMVVYLQLD